MLGAGMTLTDSLRVLHEQSRKPKLRQFFQDLIRHLQSGGSLVNALSHQRDSFSGFYLNMIEVGEMTGNLDEMLARIGAYLDKISNLRRRMIQAFTYPALVIAVAVLSLSFLMLYVVPTFADIFRDFDAELPMATQIVLQISGFLREYLPAISAGIFAGAIILWRLFLLPAGRRFFDRGILMLPFFGNLIAKNHIAQFCRTLGTLLASRISLLDALEVASRSSSNVLIRYEIQRMKQKASRGEKLAPSRGSAIFPVMVTRMIAVGEETAELPQMLQKVADFYESELDNAIELLGSVIEPVVIVFLGGAIGAILISIYLPLFNMAEIMPG